jgi:hypothetical protein
VSDAELGRIAYDTYASVAGGKSLVTGAELPAWELLAEPIQLAWQAAAVAVANAAADE